MTYRNPLTKEQKEYVFKCTKNKDKQTKLLSVWCYLIMDQGKSIGEVYRHHRNNAIKKKRTHLIMSERYFYKLAKIIHNFDIPGQAIGQEIGQGEKEVKIVDITSLEHSQEVHKNKDKVNIYNNTLYTDTVSVNELTVFAELLMDELKIKSLFVRTLVTKNLSLQTGINRIGMLAYITKTIANAKALLERSRRLFIINKNKKAKDLQQIDNYNNAINSTFNNFKAREYDYDTLEKELLGW